MIICVILCPVLHNMNQISDAAERFTGGRAPNELNPGMQNINKFENSQ